MLPQSVAVSTTQFIHTKANQHASHQHTNCFPSQYSLDLFVGLRYAMTEITTPLPTTNAHTKATNDAAIDFLKMFKCSSPVFPNDVGSVVRVFDTATIQEAFQKMTTSHVLSLPVVHHQTGRPLYVLTLMDIVAYLLNHFKEEEFKQDFYHKLTHWMSDKTNAIANAKVTVIEEKAEYDVDPVFSVPQDATLQDAVNVMLENKCHRVLVLNESGEMENLITQSRVVQFLASAADSMPKCAQQLDKLNLGFKPVITIDENETAFRAFKLMIEKRVSALAVIDHHGHLSGNISISDIKLVGFDSSFWNLLGLPVKEYLLKIAQKPELTKARSHLFAMLQEPGQPPIVVKCRAFDTLGFVLKLVTFYRVHRLYIVDGDHKPVGVLSLHDILEALCTK